MMAAPRDDVQSTRGLPPQIGGAEHRIRMGE
jgi:hypothetical protein